MYSRLNYEKFSELAWSVITGRFPLEEIDARVILLRSPPWNTPKWYHKLFGLTPKQPKFYKDITNEIPESNCYRKGGLLGGETKVAHDGWAHFLKVDPSICRWEAYDYMVFRYVLFYDVKTGIILGGYDYGEELRLRPWDSFTFTPDNNTLLTIR